MISSVDMNAATDNPDHGDTLRLLQITDPHLSAHIGRAMRGVDTYRSLQDVLNHTAGLGWQPDAILATGDLVHDGSKRGYEHFRKLLGQFVAKSNAVVFTLPGNHDDPEPMRETLSDEPFQYCGHADLAAWRLIFLDTWLAVDAGGLLRDSELERLDDLLNAAGNKHVLVCLHHHPVDMGSRWLDSVGLRNAAQFLEIIDRYSNVRGVIWGHVHQEYDNIRNDVRYLSSPSTCAQFKPNNDDFALDERPPGFRWLELAADGSINSGVEWMNAPAAKEAAR
ncbi:MAG: phosphodiesterase [Gammaproteobacteria bacterium]|nr:phosphodiesterase [Gammaproteobacteria bacterium]